MLEKFKRENIIYKLITMAVLAAAVFFVCRAGYAALRTLPYSRELLEPSNVALTDTFLEGKSPYSLESLSQDKPAVNYDYPFLNSLLAAAVSKVTGADALISHLSISFLCIILSGLIGVLMVKDRTETTVAPALASILFMFCHWRFGYISAAPDDLGLLIFLATLYAAVSPKISHKSICCALGITLCFYTKQYFVFAAASIFIYMLLYSRKEAFKLFSITIALNVVIAYIIYLNWPLYWMRTIAFTYLGSAGSAGGGMLSTLIEQVEYLAFPFAALFAIIAVAVFMAARKLKKSGKKPAGTKVQENDVLVLSVVNSIVMLAPLFVLGRNDGAFLSYFLQLWLHSIVVIALICFEKMRPEKHEKIYMGLYSAIALFTIYFGFGKLPVHILTDEEIAQWQKAYAYIDQYKQKGDIYYSRSLAYKWLSDERREDDDIMCGHDGELNIVTIDSIESTGVSPDLFPHIDTLVDQNLEYRKYILNKAENRDYALITLDPQDSYLFYLTEYDHQFEDYGYKRIDELELRLGNMPYKVLFFAIE